jgi:hypothetical protein
MGVLWVSNGTPKDQLTPGQETYEGANTLFIGVVIGALSDHLKDVHLCKKNW